MTGRPERFLIVRLSAIGDVVHGLPTLCALRDGFPDAYIAWLAESAGAQVIEGHTALDKIITVPKGWLKSPKAIWGLRNKLHASGFDTAIDLQGLTKSAIGAWLSGAGTRVGFAGADGRELSGWVNNEFIEPTATHVVTRNLELLQPFGLETGDIRFDLPVKDEIQAKVDKCISDNSLSNGFAVINPGAGWVSKLWPRERYALVAQYLKEIHGLSVLVLWAGDVERGYAEEIVDKSGGCATIAPSTDLQELKCFLARAEVAVGSDTGPMHIAAALGRRSVGLFGPMPAERNGLFGVRVRNMQSARFAGSSRERRNAPPEVMGAITVDQVCEACDDLLSDCQG